MYVGQLFVNSAESSTDYLKLQCNKFPLPSQMVYKLKNWEFLSLAEPCPECCGTIKKQQENNAWFVVVYSWKFSGSLVNKSNNNMMAF